VKTAHTEEAGQTYSQHLVFAVGAGFSMLLSACFFIVHGVVPWVPVPSRYNLLEMSVLLLNKNKDLKSRKQENLDG
jgi:hypothetical protein